MIQDIASVATAVGVFIALWGLRQSRRQRLREFESFYVQRYWKLMDDLSLVALKGDGRHPLGQDDEKAVRAYLVLCEDEMDLRQAGWISDATWRLWRTGLRSNLSRWPFSHVWGAVSRDSTDSFRHVRGVMQDADYEPCKLDGFQRLLRGLSGGPTP